jgi:hypothetical protein
MLKTKDGTTLYGDLISNNDSIVTINTNSLGILNLPVNQIISSNDVVCSRMINGDYWFENPSSNFYMITPSSFSIGKGNFYYRNTVLFLNTFGFGITDNLSLSTGFFSLFVNNTNPIFFLLPQFNFALIGNFSIGTSFLLVNGNNTFVGLPLLNFSYGSEDSNIGIGTGYNIGNINNKNQKPFFMINGLHRISNKFALEAEYINFTNYSNTYILNYGFKFMSRFMSIDFGLIYNPEISKVFSFVPFVSFTVKK